MTNNDIIQNSFREWTANLSAREARISVFEHVRDIPYAVIPTLRNSQEGPQALLEIQCGSCTPKHFLLGTMFEKLDLQIKYVTYPYFWREAAINYPLQLKEMAKNLPPEYHLACKVRLNNMWVLVDATWDKSLLSAGFPVNESWDGLSSLKLAVNAFDEIEHKNALERDNLVAKMKKKLSLEEHLHFDAFYELLNQWLENIR